MRNVQIDKHEEFDTVTVHTQDEVKRVVGYLTLWAIHSERYCTLRLYLDKDGNVNALYKDAKGAVTYEIFGMRNPDDGSYTTHS